MALEAFWAIGAGAAPGDIFTVAAPAAGAAPPATTPVNAGDASVATKTGAFEYSFPITVPPGRHGVQPKLALAYSSQAPIYGGIAAGWSLAIPIITLDTSLGRMRNTTGSGNDPEITKTYMSSMAGNRPLVAVTEPSGTGAAQTYRAQNDTTFVRYERMEGGYGYQWRAHAPDGTDYYFGDNSHVGDCTIVSDEYAPLTSQIDPFGNAIEYWYEAGVDGECRIAKVTWGQNAAASIASFATLTFTYSTPTCFSIPIGQQVSYRTGTKIVIGASELDRIDATVGSSDPTYRRTIALSYDGQEAGACTAPHAPYRALTAIQETATNYSTGNTVSLPAVRFTYGSANVSYPASIPMTLPWSGEPPNPWEPSTTFSLAWGYRFESGQLPTVEEMMVDIDGDGLPDRLFNAAPVGGSEAQPEYASCTAMWMKNLGNFRFGNPQRIPLPTLKWQTLGSNPWAGGPTSNAASIATHTAINTKPLMVERCALNYQATAYVNSTLGGFCGDGSTCTNADNPLDPEAGYCANGAECCAGSACSGTGISGAPPPTYLAYRWIDMNGDGLADLVAGPSQGAAYGGDIAYDFQQGTGIQGSGGLHPPPEPPIFGAFPPCDRPGVEAGSTPNDYEMCGGMYPWFVYLNHGNGRFGTAPTYGTSPTPDEIKYQPMPLEADTGDTSMLSNPVGAMQGNVDVDGDGRADAVTGNGTAALWTVFPSGSDGTFETQPGTTTPWTLDLSPIQSPDYNYINEYYADGSGNTSGLTDLNGDGLADRWYGATTGSATVSFNDGAAFRDPEVTLSIRPGTDFDDVIDSEGSDFVYQGRRWDVGRALDLDGDGRPDVVQPSPTPGDFVVQALFNFGAQFPYSFASSSWFPIRALYNWIEVIDGAGGIYRWEGRSDMIDLDGDGIPEGVDFGSGVTNPRLMKIYKIATPTQPPRLLATIDNGRGVTTTLHYEPLTATQNTLMPQPEWVVSQMTVTDHLSGTTSTTSYAYTSPHWSPDDRNLWGFRGFDQVVTTRPSGAQLIERFDFGVDWSGELVTSIVQANDPSVPADNGPVTIDDTRWEQRTLFDGALVTFHPVQKDHWRCPAASTEPNCRQQALTNHRRTVTQLSALASTSSGDDTPLLWAPTEVDQYASTEGVGSGTTLTDGDRKSITTYDVFADTSLYRLREASTIKQALGGGTWATFGHTAHTYDAAGATALTDEVWVDDLDANRAITAHEYDSTGNVTKQWKPVQHDGDGADTSYTYDSNLQFLQTQSDELGHGLAYEFDPGTGVKIVTLGPDAATCGSACGSGLWPTELHQIKPDALGRSLERDEPFSDDGAGYTLYPVETFTYNDNAYASGGSATSVVHQAIIDFDEGSGALRYVQDQTKVDGHGRPIVKTVFANGAAPADAVTTYAYNNDGTLASITVPDPSKNDTSTVQYTYTYDSVGRATGMRRPDASGAGRSGVDIAHDGFTTTQTEAVGSAGGTGGITVTQRDRYGRTIEVDELVGSGAYAATAYTYSPDDNVRTITDPEGVSTTLTHDYAGHRTAIERASGTWSYTYDKNGNVKTETMPCDGSDCGAEFITTIAYDDLDRPTSKAVAPGTLSADDQALFGVGLETFTYDVGPNSIGRLSSWATYGPGSGAPTNQSTFSYNAQGQVVDQPQGLNLPYAGLSGMTRDVSQLYNLAGNVASVDYQDFNAGGGCPDDQSALTYDNKGLPASIEITLCANAPLFANRKHSYVNDTRNVAGLVTRQYSASGNETVWPVESDWQYDALGRVQQQLVEQNGASVVGQWLGYFGNDEPASMSEFLGSDVQSFSYSYDARHQLLSAQNTVPSGDQFTAAYGYGSAGRFTTVSESANSEPGSSVQDRNVVYQYGGIDPEQVTELDDAVTDQPVAAYTYDAQGNETARCSGGGTAADCAGTLDEYTYDGGHQLRRVTKQQAGAVQGSEEYWYDNTGARTQIVRKDASGNVTELVWFLGGVEAHYNASGQPSESYTTISLGAPVARIDRTADSTEMQYQFHGLAGSTLAAIDHLTGTVDAAFSYAPFGEVIEAVDSGADDGVSSQHYLMNDKYVDAIDSLAYYGFRYYDNLSMQWTQSDPLYRFVPDLAKHGSPREANLYAFSLNNPLEYQDPDGRAPKTKEVRGPFDPYDSPSTGKDEFDTVESADSEGGTATNQQEDGKQRDGGCDNDEDSSCAVADDAGNKKGLRPPTGDQLSKNKTVIAAMNSAYADATKDSKDIHEEGGWVYMNVTTGEITTVRSTGHHDRISVDLSNPPTVDGSVVVADFHIHPDKVSEDYPDGNHPSHADKSRALVDHVPHLIKGWNMDNKSIGIHVYGMEPRRSNMSLAAPGYP